MGRLKGGDRVSRFGSHCKRCRCFRENITSPEIREGMVKQEQLCFAGCDVYGAGDCRFFLDLQEPVEEIVKIILNEVIPIRSHSRKGRG